MFDQILKDYNKQCRCSGQLPTFYGFIKFGRWSRAMIEMLLNYIQCCRVYNWEPSILGLVLFPGQIEAGVRKGVITVD